MSNKIRFLRGSGASGSIDAYSSSISLAEPVLVTGSFDDLTGPILLVGDGTDAVPVNRILTGTTTPTLGTSIYNDMLYYNSADQQLVILNNSGNTILSLATADTASYVKLESIDWQTSASYTQVSGAISDVSSSYSSLSSSYVNDSSSFSTDISNIEDGTTIVPSASLAQTASYVDWDNVVNKDSGIVSSSAQIATEISGAFTEASSGFESRISTIETSGVDNAQTASYVENAQSASYVSWGNIDSVPAGIVSSSTQIASEISGAFNDASASIATDINNIEQDITNISNATGSYLTTGSSDTDVQNINGGLKLTGDITAENYIVSSSILYQTQSYSSGSTIFGDDQTDTHQFTGSVLISGSLALTPSTQTVNMTSSWSSNSVTSFTASYIDGGTF